MIVAAVIAAAPTPGAAIPHVITYPAAFFAPTGPTTALDMLQHTPGFTFDAGADARGFAGAAGNVLVDGARPASKDDTLDDVLRRIPASSVLRVEVILGGAPGIDMQGRSVLANVVRRRDAGGKLTVTATATHGLDDQVAGSVLIEGEERVGNTAYEGSLRVAELLDNGVGAGLWTRAFGTGGGRFTASELSRGAQEIYKATGAVETPLFGGSIRVNASVTSSPYAGYQNDTLTPPPGVERDRPTLSQDSVELGARYRAALSPTLSLESFVLQRLGRQTTIDTFLSDPQTAARTRDDVSAYFSLKKKTGESIARTNFTLEVKPTLAVQFGGEGDYNFLSSHTLYFQNGAPSPLPAANVDVNELRGEVFATTTWQALPTFTVEAGLRMEASHISSSGDVVSARSLYYPKPRLALAWSPDTADQVRLSVEREVGQLNFDDFTAQAAGLNTGTVHAGNPTLNPGQHWVLEATWDRRFWRGGDITLTLRRFWLEDVVDRIGVASPSGTYDAPGNIGAGARDEAYLTVALPLDRLAIPHGMLTGTATVRKSRVTDPTTGQVRELSGLHQSDWEIHYTQGVPAWRASFGADVYGPSTQTFYRFDEIDTDKQSMVVSMFADYTPRMDITFKIEALNVAGQGIEHSRQAYNGPRNSTGLDFTDVHHIRAGHFIRLRFVKTFR
ncbi:MAG: TonB-dependent receptor [Caulobacteraceae bacterium]|nr:TonB-dependent receptor [Caulobacteraceae bacterium]